MNEERKTYGNGLSALVSSFVHGMLFLGCIMSLDVGLWGEEGKRTNDKSR